MTAFIFLLILSFLVIIHEIGHLVTALWMKVKVEEFGIGYPPLAKKLFTWRGIPFTLNWLPFGGFVRMQGEDGPEAEQNGNDKQVVKNGIGPFYTKSKRARLFVLLAGVFLNFLFGVMAFSIVYTKVGIPTTTYAPLIVSVAEGSPASEAGIQPEDVFIEGNVVCSENAECNDQRVFSTSEEVVQFVNENIGEEVLLTYKRGEEKMVANVFVRPQDQRPEGEGAIGVGFATYEFKFYPWWQMPFRGMWVGLQQSFALSIMIVGAFVGIFTQLFTQATLPEGVAGPVGIVHQASRMGLFQEGWTTILNFAGMLSINLAVLNILPIPALDGGRAMFVLLETFIGKTRREKIEGYSNYIGFGFLLLFIGVITLKDIVVLIKDLL